MRVGRGVGARGTLLALAPEQQKQQLVQRKRREVGETERRRTKRKWAAAGTQ